jgi:RNA polymerase sigma factor (sigma-70 family)
MEPSGLLFQPVRLAGTSLLRLQSDDRLVELARAGHEPAFDTIVHRYRPALLRYCTRLLGPERAEDAVQQALASAHTAMTNGDERHLQLRPWLYRIAHNTALNALRGSRREEVELVDAAFAAAHTPHDEVAERERLESILQAIAALPRSQRDALLLRELEGRSHEEIGRALGVSSGAARATLFRARAAVRTACSALTPSPLLLRFAELGASDGGSSHLAAKAAAGVLAGCALVGGGASTGVLGGTHHPKAPTAQAATPKREVTTARPTAPTTPKPVSVTSSRAAAGAGSAPAPAAALKAVRAPKPVRVATPKPKPHKPPHTAAPPAVVEREHGHERHGPAPDRSEGRLPATSHGRGHAYGRGKHAAPVAPAPAPKPDHAHAQGHAKHDVTDLRGPGDP